MIGKCQIDYVAEETPMITYANVHFAVENLREYARASNTLGPRILIVGPDNAGKTSLVKLLAAYATRSGRKPVVANVDPKEGMLTVPGTLSTVALESILDVEDGWGSSPTNGPSQIPVKLPLVYHYGLEDPDAYGDLFKPLVRRLALSVINRMEEDAEVKQAGCIIDTAGSMSQGKGSYDIIQHIVAEFQGKQRHSLPVPVIQDSLHLLVNVLIVLGSERLYSDMTRRFAKKSANIASDISVVKLDKSGGCVDRDSQYLQQLRQSQIREYFFGNAKNTLSPHSQFVNFDEVSIYRPVERKSPHPRDQSTRPADSTESSLLTSLLPGGDVDESSKPEIFESVEPSPMMQNALLAIVQAAPGDSQESIRDSSVIGFVYISEVDEKRRKLRVLAPVSGRLPRRAMIWGVWPEIVGDLMG